MQRNSEGSFSLAQNLGDENSCYSSIFLSLLGQTIPVATNSIWVDYTLKND